MTTQKIKLNEIDPNPWQTRQEDNPEVVSQIAASILTEGLLQTPVGRRKDGKIELAFGHTRLAAYRELSQSFDTYTHMPVDIRKLSDERMAELAIIENLARQDLSPIEEAMAMLRYKDDFNKSTADVAELFNCKPATVRSKLRLLDLPKQVMALVHAGDLPERTGRRMLTLGRLDPKSAEAVANTVAIQTMTPSETEDEIARSMREAAREISARWDHGKVAGGWWPLDAKFRALIEPKISHVTAAVLPFYGDDKKAARKEGKRILQLLQDGQGIEDVIKLHDGNAWMVERIQQLRQPPPCLECEHHSIFGGIHFCAFDECFKAKKVAWIERDVRKVKRKKALKEIAWYVRKDDDKALRPENWQTGKNDYIKAKLKRRTKDVRLYRRGTPHSSYRARGVLQPGEFVEVVLVGKARDKYIAKRGESSSQPYDWEAENAKREHLRWLRWLIKSHAAGHFSSLFDEIKDIKAAELLVRMLTRNEDWQSGELFEDYQPDAKPAQRLAHIREFLAGVMLQELHSLFGKDTHSGMINHIEGVAKQHGVKLPKDWAAAALKEIEEALAKDKD